MRATRGSVSAVSPFAQPFPTRVKIGGDSRTAQVLKSEQPRRHFVRARVTMTRMRVVRCPRCLAEDISADAHPARRLNGEQAAAYFVCRNCLRAAELEFRISSDRAGLAYAPLPIRESLRLLREFYRERVADSPDDPAVSRPLADVDRRLAIGPLQRS